MYSIEVKNLGKRYQIGSRLHSLRDAIWPRIPKNEDNIHWAVKDVNFALTPGQSLGIIGPNGAGKTTILKMLAQVTPPTEGYVKLNGRFSALIALGAGFHPDLTGRENVYLNGAILGMKRSEINERFDQIVAFADIGRFIDTPVKRYSSGMYARLGFAIAAHVDPDILLVDEVLAVGDYAFQMKCYSRMDELRQQGTSLIFISHNMDAVRRVCDNAMVMYQGKSVFHGSAGDAIVAYSDVIRQAAKKSQLSPHKTDGLAQKVMTFDAEIEAVTVKTTAGQQVNTITSGQTIQIYVKTRFHKAVQQPIFSLTIRTTDGRAVYITTSQWQQLETTDFPAHSQYNIIYNLQLTLLEGQYDIGVDIAAHDLSHYYDRLERALTIQVIDNHQAQGIIDLSANISWEPISVEVKQ
ncbi:MAG TPA: ABC transporter ATP-binding protein [Anaerolineae bacterium]|nr:ABC transporter ATP-binding protein [Anaerolineae bacterium]